MEKETIFVKNNVHFKYVKEKNSFHYILIHNNFFLHSKIIFVN